MAAGRADVLLVSSDSALIEQVRRANLTSAALRTARNVPRTSTALSHCELWLDLDRLPAQGRGHLAGLTPARRVYFQSRRATAPPDLPAGVFIRKPCKTEVLSVLWSHVSAGNAKRTSADTAIRANADVQSVSASAVLPDWLLDCQELNIRRLAPAIALHVPRHFGFRRAALYVYDRRGRSLRLAPGMDDDRFAASMDCDPATLVAPADAGSRSGEARLPLRHRGRLIGLIHLVERTSPPATTLDPRSILAFLAGAVANAQSFTRARRQARIDSLTGLQNLRGIRETLQRELYRAERLRSDVCILLLDLDGLKRINDQHGHAVGDRVLTQAAERITSALRQMDCAARRGGDEFVAILPGTTLAGAQRVAQRVLETLRSDPVRAGGTTHAMSASIGVAQSTPDGNVDGLLEAADQAMYTAKRGGGGQVVCHSAESTASRPAANSGRRRKGAGRLDQSAFEPDPAVESSFIAQPAK